VSQSAPSDQRSAFERKYVIALAIAAAVLAVLPNLYGLIAAPPGSSYQGFQWAADDQFVYAAWMRQAIEGRFLFDNRFTTDPQPGLTIHLYFLVLGWVAKLVGIPIALALAKMTFSALFVFLAHRLIQRLTHQTYITKLALAFVSLGGGLGFLVWENFGPEIERPGAMGKLLAMAGVPGVPNDVWQPEAFVFPSMLTNGLFMVSLCLILASFLCFLDSRHSWKPVLPGAIFMGLLMNIHSYDVVLVALVLVAFLAMQLVKKQMEGIWVARAIVMASGIIPPALWMVHVLRSDAVFQQRAATPTYSPNFKILFLGYLLMMLVSAFLLAKPEIRKDRRKVAGISVAALVFTALFFLSPPGALEGYFLTIGPWCLVFLGLCAACMLMASDVAAINLVIAWAIVGVVAPYFPALFERKLTMGLSIPWAILAAFGIGAVALHKDRSRRNLITVLTILVLGGTSLRWFFREIELIKLNVSNTTVHSVYLTRDERAILDYLDRSGAAAKRTVVMALPGIAQKVPNELDQFREPVVTDLNPLLSGFAGVYTFAGHWSETPDYLNRRNLSTELFLASTSEDRRRQILDMVKPDYLVSPTPDSLPGIADLSSYGKVVAGGNQFQMIELAR
jgi:arabinosyltransferase C